MATGLGDLLLPLKGGCGDSKTVGTKLPYIPTNRNGGGGVGVMVMVAAAYYNL